jgi:NAD(P)-dependent dehydrogenase (short-subunit alcohol dehydrogenase family)
MKRLDGGVAWITGGGSGLGAACAAELARRGARIALSGRRVAHLEAVAAPLRAAGAEVRVVPCDVTDEASVRAAVADIVAAWGGIDLLLANAGFAVNGPVATLSVADWRRQYDTNLFGLVACVTHALPSLRARRGRIGLVGSVAAYLPIPGSAAYASSKAAVHLLGHTLRAELAPDGVSVTVLHPGFVESEIGQVDNRGVHHASRPDRRPARLMWPAPRAARVMVDAVLARRAERIFTGHGRIGAFIGRHLPWLVPLLLGSRDRTTGPR